MSRLQLHVFYANQVHRARPPKRSVQTFFREHPDLELDHGTLHAADLAERAAKVANRQAGIAQDFAERPFEKPSQDDSQ